MYGGAGSLHGRGLQCQTYSLESKKGLHCGYANCAVMIAMGVNLDVW